MRKRTIARQKQDINRSVRIAREIKAAVALYELLIIFATPERPAAFVLYAGARVDAKVPAAQVKATAEIDIFIIATTKCGVEAANFKKNVTPDQECVATKAVCTNVTAGLAHISIQIVPGIVVAGGNNDR